MIPARCSAVILLFEHPTFSCTSNGCAPAIPAKLIQFDCRNNQLLLCAAQQITAIEATSETGFGPCSHWRCAGTSTSGIPKGEAALSYRNQHGHFPADYHYFQQELGSIATFLRQYFELDGPCYTISTACSSSAKVFASAKRLLSANLCDMVIVGGVDSLCQLTVNGFNALESVSKGHCNPFSINRDGINIGEGAALFVLTAGESDVMLAGIGESSDAIIFRRHEGAGAITAMQAALQDAILRHKTLVTLTYTAQRHPKMMRWKAALWLKSLASTPRPAARQTLSRPYLRCLAQSNRLLLFIAFGT